jgi:hypothetical protein
MKRIDLQDVLLLLGILFIVGGIFQWSRAAASVVLGLIFLAFVYSIQTSRPPDKPEGKR